MGRRAPHIHLSDKQRHILESWQRGTHVPQHLQQRATIILLAATGADNQAIAQQTGWNRNTVKKWRRRWASCIPELQAVERDRPWALRSAVKAALQDAPRPGHPPTFTPEQVAHIIKLACDDPSDYAVPITQWTPSALAREAIKQGIVERISPRQVGRFLKRRPI